MPSSNSRPPPSKLSTYGTIASQTDKPTPSGPLGRVSSRPTFVPCMQIDFEQVAEHVSRTEGTHLTADQLLEGLVDPEPSNNDTQPSIQSSVETISIPLKVEIPPSHNIDVSQFTDDETLILRIRPDDEQSTQEQSNHIPFISEPNPHTDGFAISIAVSNDPIDMGATTPMASSWYTSSLPAFSEIDPDEENPLIQDELGIDLSARPDDDTALGAAFVQRLGARDVAKEQQVMCAVPNADNLSGKPGLFIPVVDSSEDLKQLVLVVPPEVESETISGESQTTAEVTREYVDTLTNYMPPIVDVESTLEVHGTTDNATVAIAVSKQVSWAGYFILAIALFSVASQGTAVKWLPSVGGMIAAAWLMQAQTLLMLPFALFQLFTLNKEEREQLRRPSTLRLLVAASIAQVCWASGFFLSIAFTSLFHAWSLNNIHALTIVLLAIGKKYLFGDKAGRIGDGEVQGARVAAIGVLIMQIPAMLSLNSRSVFGDTVAAMSSLGAIIFLDLCKELRNRIPLFLMMTPISAMNSVMFSFASMIIFGTDFSMTDNGALGWMKSDRIILGLYLGGVVGFLGTVCCIAALKFLPNVVVGSVQTMMPVVGTVVAVLVGVDTIPDFWTTCGGILLLGGVLMIADATRRSELVVVLNEHMSEVGTPQPQQEQHQYSSQHIKTIS